MDLFCISAFIGLVQRPIYNLAHMVNGEHEIYKDWVNYANAIEADLRFNSDGSPSEFYHGFPCDCGRDCFKSDDVVAYFATIKSKAQDSQHNLALFKIDLKLSSSGISDYFSSGQKLAQVLTGSESLFPPDEDVPLSLVLSTGDLDTKDFFVGFRESIQQNRPELLPKFGYVFSDPWSSLDVDVILNTFESIGITDNIWVGDGITNCLPRDIKRLKTLLAKRDSAAGLAPHKVFAWTLDTESTMREYLQLGVDAIIVNFPDRMKNVVENQFSDSLYFATSATDPWERIKASEAIPPLAHGCSVYFLNSYCWKYTTPDSWCWTSTLCRQDSDCSESLGCS